MKAFAGAMALAFILSATPMVALADDGDTTDATTPSDDPGITALHDAIDAMRAAGTAFRADCPSRSEAKCHADAKAARDAFKDARRKAIEEHHAFKEEQKKARAAAHEQAMAARKARVDQLREKARDTAADAKAKASDAPKPSPSPRG